MKYVGNKGDGGGCSNMCIGNNYPDGNLDTSAAGEQNDPVIN